MDDRHNVICDQGANVHMDVSENGGFSPQIIHFDRVFRFSIINHPFWGTPIFGNTHMCGIREDLSIFWLTIGW